MGRQLALLLSFGSADKSNRSRERSCKVAESIIAISDFEEEGLNDLGDGGGGQGQTK